MQDVGRPTVRGVPGNAAQGPARGEAGLWAATPPVPSAQAVMMGEEEAELGAAVELRGLPPDVPDELLTLYFENRRSSGGGPVSSWQRLGRGGILTFQEAAGEWTHSKGQPGPPPAAGPDTPSPCLQMQRGSWPRRSTLCTALG